MTILLWTEIGPLNVTARYAEKSMTGSFCVVFSNFFIILLKCPWKKENEGDNLSLALKTNPFKRLKHDPMHIYLKVHFVQWGG